MEKSQYKVRNSSEDDVQIIVDLDDNEAKLLDTIFNQLNDTAPIYAPTITLTKL